MDDPRRILDALRRLPALAEPEALEAGEVRTDVERDPPIARVEMRLARAPEDILTLLTRYEKLPEAIAALTSAEVLEREGERADVRFVMTLPFPIGAMSWTTRVWASQREAECTMAWTLLEGQLDAFEGALLLSPAGERGEQTHARYRVHVEPSIRLPRAAQRLATRWLLPRIVDRIRAVVARSHAEAA